MLDDICEAAKQEMDDKQEDELGSWKCAVTVADGTWQTRGWHSKNATFTIRNYIPQWGSPVLSSPLPKGQRQSNRGRLVHGHVLIRRRLCHTHNLSKGQRGGNAGCRPLAGRRLHLGQGSQ